MVCPARQVRRMRGKPDQIAAYAATHAALAASGTVTAKTSDGTVEATRVTLTARRSALKARTEVIRQIKSLLATAPEPVRADYRDLSARLGARQAGAWFSHQPTQTTVWHQ